MPRTVTHQALALASHINPASLFFVDDGDADVVEAEADVAVPVEFVVLTKTYISPVESLLMNKRP